VEDPDLAWLGKKEGRELLMRGKNPGNQEDKRELDALSRSNFISFFVFFSASSSSVLPTSVFSFGKIYTSCGYRRVRLVFKLFRGVLGHHPFLPS